jgi:propionate CoA-transferase
MPFISFRNGDTVAVAGFLGQGGPEQLLSALARRCQMVQSPTGLTLIFCVGPADWNDKGLNHFGHEGMMKLVIRGYYGGSPCSTDSEKQGRGTSVTTRFNI